MTTQVGMTGHAPKVLVQPINRELSKYRALWALPEYRIDSPGEKMASEFLSRFAPPRNSLCIDFGCGTGRGALMLAAVGGLKVAMLDFAENCLDPEVAQACETQGDRLSFTVADLTKPIPIAAPSGFCCDVMEHVPTDDVPLVLRNILGAAQHVFFGISLVPDQMGALIGEQLHLTVKPLAWWEEQLRAAGAVVHWAVANDGYCAIYCSSWAEAAIATKNGVVNTEAATIDAQVRANVEAKWLHVVPHREQPREIVLLAGGPSMAGELERIRLLRDEGGCALVTVNGAYGWAIENGLVPSAQIVLDGREFNARFVQPVVETCQYLIASQVHPSVLAGLPRERTRLWHSGLSAENETLVREVAGAFFPVPGGSTVVLRAIPLMRMLGFRRMHVFGFDSCIFPEGAHHAYTQAENDGDAVIPVTCGGRVFLCAPWMVSQASEFRDLVRLLGDEVELAIYGDGLIAHMLATGASLSSKD